MMNEPESQVATAREIYSLAQSQGVDVIAILDEWVFLDRGRFISLWRRDDKVHYNMQGSVLDLPTEFLASADAIRGMWHEAGSLVSLEQAFELLKAWIVERREVDDLTETSRRRWRIG